MSPSEVAVGALLQLDDAREALGKLEEFSLVHSHPPIGGAGERLFELTGDGQKVYRAFAQYKGKPPVGTTIRVPRPFPTFSDRFQGKSSLHIFK